ncbi:MAG: hypothetical protein V3V72_11870 [Ignavibacteriaceae bacterium]
MKKLFYSILVTFFLLFGTNIHSQTFGFGCLGFVGGYGGFTYQQYDAAGLNGYVNLFNLLSNPDQQLSEFKYATGYRVGLNFFRATFQGGFIFTAKGYYQSLGKKNNASFQTDEGQVNAACDLDLKNWAIGFDVGIDITKHFSWKILDGAVHFNNVTLTETKNFPGVSQVEKYKNEAGEIGYSVGTGVIIAIIKDYISIEGLAGYTFITIDELWNEDGVPFTNWVIPANIAPPPDNKFIESGGFTAVIQLNIGFPL